MHFPDDMIILEKADRSRPISVVYFNGLKEYIFYKKVCIRCIKRRAKIR